MALSPRQLMGKLHFAELNEKRNRLNRLSLHAMAAQGDHKEIKKQIEELSKDV